MDSELEDIARKCKLKWTTHLSGRFKAPSEFSLQSVRNFASVGKISIVRTLDVDIKASRMICSVVVGFFYLLIFPRKISVDLCRDPVSPGAAIFEQDMLFEILFIADWQKIGEHRQQLTDLNNACENKGRIDYNYKVGQKVLLRKEGILHNAESRWHKKPWLITSVHKNGRVTVQYGNKIDRMNIQRVKPCEEDLDSK
jgi:hypothetical protein